MNSRRHPFAFLVCSAVLGALLTPAKAADVTPLEIPRDQHVWGKFPKGAWKRVRLRTENVDAQGRTTDVTITESKTLLDKVEDSGVTLRIEQSVQAQGKRFESPVQIVQQGYNGQTIGQPVDVQPLGGETLTIDNKRFPCQVWQVQLGNAGARRTSRVFYTASVAPYVLRRESTWTEPNRPSVVNETVSEVIALDMPYRVLDEVHSTAFEKTVFRNSQSVTTTVSVTSPDVPGGVVGYNSKEVDLQGRLIRRSTLELLDYSVSATEGEHQPEYRQRIPRRERRAAKRQ